jgi:hypothetical protein
VRTVLILALAGLGVGLALALLIAASRPAGTASACTSMRLGLAPTLAVAGRTIAVGLTAPGTGCVVPAGAPTTVRIRVRGRDGHVVVDSVQRGGPAPGAEIAARLTGSITVDGAKLCRAAQPLQIDVAVAGAHASGSQSVHLVRGRCVVAS